MICGVVYSVIVIILIRHKSVGRLVLNRPDIPAALQQGLQAPGCTAGPLKPFKGFSMSAQTLSATVT